VFERILVPLDGSQFSARALPYALQVAQRFGGDLTLLQVVRPAPMTAPVTSPAGGPLASGAAMELLVRSAKEQDTHNSARARGYLRRKCRQVEAAGVKASFHVVIGDPAEAIVRFCKTESVGLVVMTTSGKTGLKRAFLGSVADRVIREPGFPVLAIRPLKRPKK
jgi:nucleotide-binding universal stress UspA family protein